MSWMIVSEKCVSQLNNPINTFNLDMIFPQETTQVFINF